jgi:hypothetical protein
MMRYFAMIALALAAQTAAAQAPAANDGEITVVGMGGNGLKISPELLARVAQSFTQHRGQFAPAAQLLWRVRPASMANAVQLRLTSADDSLPIAIDAEGHFALPIEKLASGRYRLVGNRPPQGIRIQPLVLSPGSSLTHMRFGDARLTCEVNYSFAAHEHSAVARGLFNALGGCAAKSIRIFFKTDMPIAAVHISHWPHEVQLGPDRKAFRPPFYDKAIGMDEVIEVTPR